MWVSGHLVYELQLVWCLGCGGPAEATLHATVSYCPDNLFIPSGNNGRNTNLGRVRWILEPDSSWVTHVVGLSGTKCVL